MSTPPNKLSVRSKPEIYKVLLNKTPEFPFWGLIICVDFESKKMLKYEETK